MTYRQIRKCFLITFSFLVFGALFSCKNQNKTDPPKEKEKEMFSITFKVSPEQEGSIVATCDGNTVTSGVTKIGKDKEVIFTLTIKNSEAYELEGWEGAEKDSANPLVAKLKVSKDATVTAKLRQKTVLPADDLNLSSLRIYDKDVDISNLTDVKLDVSHFVLTLQPGQVTAMFTYGTQTTPKRIGVNIDKKNLDVGVNNLKLSVKGVAGEYNDWMQEVKITRASGESPSEIPTEVKAEAIEVAIIGEKKGKAQAEAFKQLEGFSAEKSGPYSVSEQAKTAYVDLRVKIAKPATGDFTISALNKTTYIDALDVSRQDNSYSKKVRITLSKGLNILEVKIESPDKSKTGTYTVVVWYEGGPDPNDLPMKDRKTIPGIYCPAQRKPLEGEKPDHVWLIIIAGW